MSKTLHYLYDPLCGWCYGAMPAISELTGIAGIRIELLPTGLFADHGARSMDDDFAAFAWSNDQSIARFTGQRFTEAYRHAVLANRKQRFDSGPATLALSAVAATAPSREHEALRAIQLARYVDGRDVTSLTTLAEVLQPLDLGEAVAMMAHSEDDLFDINHARIARAQGLLQEFAARGVPTLIVESGSERSLLNTHAVFSNPGALIKQVQAA